MKREDSIREALTCLDDLGKAIQGLDDRWDGLDLTGVAKAFYRSRMALERAGDVVTPTSGRARRHARRAKARGIK